MTDAEEQAERIFIAVQTFVDSRLKAADVEKRAMSDRIAVLERFVVAALEGKVPTSEARGFDASRLADTLRSELRGN